MTFAKNAFLRGESGTALTEFAIMAPILSALVLWSIYFWEVQEARIKAAEAARFAAYERTVGRSPAEIRQDVLDRFKNLDSTNKNANLGAAWFNKLTIQNVNVVEAGAPMASPSLSEVGGQAGGLGGFLSKATQLVGNSVDGICNFLGFKTKQGAAYATVEFKMENKVIPQRIGDYLTQASGTSLDLTFKDSHFVYYDSWKAWKPGDRPQDTYSRVQSRTYDQVKKVAYLGLMDSAAGSVLNGIGKFLSLFKLDWPLSNDYLRDSVYIRKPTDSGRYAAQRNTRTTPGDILQAVWWTNDERYCYGSSCSGSRWGGGRDELAAEPQLRYKRGLASYSSGSDRWDNWPMRSYNCRDKFFEGAMRHDRLPAEYFGKGNSQGPRHFRVSSNACINY